MVNADLEATAGRLCTLTNLLLPVRRSFLKMADFGGQILAKRVVNAAIF